MTASSSTYSLYAPPSSPSSSCSSNSAALSALRARLIGQPLLSVRTPALVLDLAIIRKNCQRLRDVTASWALTAVHGGGDGVEEAEAEAETEAEAEAEAEGGDGPATKMARQEDPGATGSLPLRCHLKTHKSPECSRLQLEGTPGRVVVSTIAELRGVIRDLVGKDNGSVVKDVCYGIPFSEDKLAELFELRKEGKTLDQDFQLRLMVDQPRQVEMLHDFMTINTETRQEADPSASGAHASVFIKVETGSARAGVLPTSTHFQAIVEAILKSPHVSFYGLYAHAGHSYSSRSAQEAQEYLALELKAVNQGAHIWKRLSEQASLCKGDFSRHSTRPVLSVGSTPTAGAARLAPAATILRDLGETVCSDTEFELHAGNYAILDMQQLATRAQTDAIFADEEVAITILSTVLSEYPQRGDTSVGQVGQWNDDGLAHVGDEVMCDAGSLAMSKDSGPFGGFGHVVHPCDKVGWELARPSQEHGILSIRKGTVSDWKSQWDWKRGADADAVKSNPHPGPSPLKMGDKIRLMPQHACLTCAAHGYFIVIDGDSQQPDIVRDVWAPWKGW